MYKCVCSSYPLSKKCFRCERTDRGKFSRFEISLKTRNRNINLFYPPISEMNHNFRYYYTTLIFKKWAAMTSSPESWLLWYKVNMCREQTVLRTHHTASWVGLGPLFWGNSGAAAKCGHMSQCTVRGMIRRIG